MKKNLLPIILPIICIFSEHLLCTEKSMVPPQSLDQDKKYSAEQLNIPITMSILPDTHKPKKKRVDKHAVDALGFLQQLAAHALPGNHTQTEAYLSLPELQELVAQSFGEQLIAYKPLIEKIIEQERALRDYFVFYHGQKHDLRIFIDVLREVQGWLNVQETTSSYHYLRVPGRAHQLRQNLQTWITTHPIFSSKVPDATPLGARLLLSTNLSLFGNSSQIANWECTFDYFLESKSVSMHPSTELLRDFFIKMGFDLTYLEQFETIFNPLKEAPTGNLLQIFIPRKRVNERAYISFPYGIPINKDPFEQIKEKKKTAFLLFNVRVQDIDLPEMLRLQEAYNQSLTNVRKLYELGGTQLVLENFVKDPQSLGIVRTASDQIIPWVDMLQARILLTNDFLNLASGVKIFMYTTDDPEKEKIYQQQLKELVATMILTWLHKKEGPGSQKREQIKQKAVQEYTKSHPYISRKYAKKSKLLKIMQKPTLHDKNVGEHEILNKGSSRGDDTPQLDKRNHQHDEL